jgi:hypothetical protein
MNTKNHVLWISLFVFALFAGLSVIRAQSTAKPEVVTAISILENDAVKADLAGDADFYQKVLAEDWTRGDSDGTYYTKARKSLNSRCACMAIPLWQPTRTPTT